MGTLSTVLTVIEALMKATPVIIQAGADIKPFAEVLYAKLSGGKELSDDERTTLRLAVDELYERLQRPLPPAQPGDPDYEKK